MIAERLNELIEAYAVALQREMKAQPEGWKLLHGNDTHDEKALRVAVKTHELITAGRLEVIQTYSEAWGRTCAVLGIPHTHDAIAGYLQGGAQ